jgi:NAD(P)-dependent dehydrogenase (short-subunit alcohol dehydrogenase family)
MNRGPTAPYDLFRLTDKVALITGGSRGLGLEIARAFAAAGADLAIASRKLENCEAAASRVVADTGRRAVPLAVNVSDWGQCDQLVERVYAEFGRVDILVNDAGMSPLYESLESVSEALFNKVIGVNLAGPFRLSSVIGTRMARGDGGSIINISSIAAIRPTPEVVPYAAAKAGLNAMTEGMARAFGPTVRVNAIQAGPFLTDISEAWDMEAFEAAAASAIALGRGGRPEEVVGAALYLASEASSYCTGAILRVDGGAR